MNWCCASYIVNGVGGETGMKITMLNKKLGQKSNYITAVSPEVDEKLKHISIHGTNVFTMFNGTKTWRSILGWNIHSDPELLIVLLSLHNNSYFYDIWLRYSVMIYFTLSQKYNNKQKINN